MAGFDRGDVERTLRRLNIRMPESFEDRDLSDSVFWGVNLQRSTFRDADLSESSFFHVFLKNASIDGEIERLVVNGVDVTDYVNQHDRWWPLRNNLSPDSVAVLRESWTSISAEWSALLEKVLRTDPSPVDRSVDGEWSLTQTMRHLAFAMDKWFTLPILGRSAFSPLGLPNVSSQGKDWPGLDPSSSAGFVEALAVRSEQHERFSGYISSLSLADLPGEVEVLENGSVPGLMCLHVVLEEEFEHLRYMIRDLTRLGVPDL